MILLFIGLLQHPSFSQTNSYGGFVFDFGFNFDFSNIDFSNLNLNINVNATFGNSTGSGNFDFTQENKDFVFRGNDFASLNAGLFFEAEKRAAYNAWYDKQRTLIKEKIESYYGHNFNDYTEAVDTILIDYGKPNHAFDVNLSNLKQKNQSTNNIYNTKNKLSLKNLKLLQFRKAEIYAGNLYNSKYPYIKVNDIALKDYNLDTIELNLNSIKTTLEPNLVKEQNAKNFITALNNLGSDFDSYLLNLQRDFYNKELNKGQRLYLEQHIINILIAYKLNPNTFHSPNAAIDYQIPESLRKIIFIPIASEETLINYYNTHGEISVFDPNYYKRVLDEILINNGYKPVYGNLNKLNLYVRYTFINIAKAQAIERKNQALNNLLNAVNVSNFAIENLIEETKNILNNVSFSDQQKFDQFKIAYNNYDSLQIISNQNDFEIKIKSYIDYFKRRGSNEFADYLSSLLPLDSTFSNEDYQKLYETIREQKLNYFYELLREVGLASFDAFKPVIEMALWEVGGTVALKILSKLPIKYLTTPIKNVIARLKAPSSTAFNNLKHAKKYGIQSYKNLKTTFDDLGLSLSKEGVERHHLIEKRFLDQMKHKLGGNTDDWMCIVLEKTNKLSQSEHYKFSQEWLKAIGKEGANGAPGIPGWTNKTTNTATFEDIIRAAKEIYKDYPEILKALGI